MADLVWGSSKKQRVLQLQLVVNGIHGAHIEEEGGLDLFSDDRTISAEDWEESKAPDSFNPQSTSTKDLLAELKSRPNRLSTVDSMHTLQHSRKEGIVEPECENNVDTVIENILTTTVAEDLVQKKTRDDHIEPHIVDVGIVQGEQKEVAEQEGGNMDGKVADVCNVVALEAIPLQTSDAGTKHVHIKPCTS